MTTIDVAGGAFYRNRYSPEMKALQDVVFGEAIDDYFGQSSLTSTADYDRMIAWLEVGPQDHVLDVACGSGAPALRLARVTKCRCTGIDGNADAIALATAAAASAGLADRSKFIVHDAEQSPPFTEASLSGVLCTDAIGHFRDWRQLLGGWRRVLRPGGRIVVTTFDITGPISSEDIADRTPNGYLKFNVPSHFEMLLAETGFDLLCHESLTVALAASSLRHAQARERHAAALRQLEGEVLFEQLNRLRRVLAQLTAEQRMSHSLWVARKSSHS